MTDSRLTDLGDERFVSLTTFRRTGVGVPTPVWVARVDDALVITTPASSGKLKRLRNNPAVTLSPCSRTGRVADGAATVSGRAEIVDDDTVAARYTTAIRRKYRFEFPVVITLERLRRAKPAGRVLLRITSG